jgi:hypothetical protein
MDPHEGKNAMYSCRPKVEYATDTMVGRIVRLKSYRVQGKKGANIFVPVHTTCRLVAFSATFGTIAQNYLLGILRLSMSLSWKIIPIGK